jgi:hypothetical protein
VHCLINQSHDQIFLQLLITEKIAPTIVKEGTRHSLQELNTCLYLEPVKLKFTYPKSSSVRLALPALLWTQFLPIRHLNFNSCSTDSLLHGPSISAIQLTKHQPNRQCASSPVGLSPKYRHIQAHIRVHTEQRSRSNSCALRRDFSIPKGRSLQADPMRKDFQNK